MLLSSDLPLATLYDCEHCPTQHSVSYVSDRIAEVSQTRAQLEARMCSCLEAAASTQFVRALADYVHFLTRWGDGAHAPSQQGPHTQSYNERVMLQNGPIQFL